MAAKKKVAKAAAKKPAKKRAARKSAAPKASGGADAVSVEAAYQDAVKNQVAVFFTNCITNTPEAEKKFCDGLAIIRQARDRALELVKQ